MWIFATMVAINRFPFDDTVTLAVTIDREEGKR